MVTIMEMLGNREGGTYKFLRLKDPQEPMEWLFWDAESILAPSHRDVAAGREVVAAGALSMGPGRHGTVEARMVDSYSSTLGVGINAKDWGVLEGVLGIAVRSRIER